MSKPRRVTKPKRRVIITLEVETNSTIADIRQIFDVGVVRGLGILRQVSVNVIRPKR